MQLPLLSSLAIDLCGCGRDQGRRGLASWWWWITLSQACWWLIRVVVVAVEEEERVASQW
ncbi:hypothetical protein E2562_033505 [Oryza meyeriana var. granulata]|uniref:Uncharacterized protein n=1 Tax=Oryza meyeriana var. granulata TaxID=110450 RepID=A0A6G1EB77_9ORYZ|nr:hypothetical protein E2562_033505 [Oryza meyeriana var. granulata]